jgi:hypothetical protein
VKQPALVLCPTSSNIESLLIGSSSERNVTSRAVRRGRCDKRHENNMPFITLKGIRVAADDSPFHHFFGT